MKFKEYMKDLLSSSDTSSSRKFVTLVIAFHFILASFVVLFFAFYVILWAPKGKVDKDLLETLKIILQYDFYIIIAGLGFVTSSDLVRVIVSKGFNPNPTIVQTTTEGDIKTEVKPADSTESAKKKDDESETKQTSYD